MSGLSSASATALAAPRVGVQPIERVFVMENHDEVCFIWREADLRQRVLVHIDAHHDMWWVEDGGPITISNFICSALKQDFFREVFWVVPDGTWTSRRGRKAVLQHLRQLVKRYPGASLDRAGRKQVTATLLGKPLLRGEGVHILFFSWTFLLLPCGHRSFVDSIVISRGVIEQLIRIKG